MNQTKETELVGWGRKGGPRETERPSCHSERDGGLIPALTLGKGGHT